jgi:putative restriction endonuclease
VSKLYVYPTDHSWFEFLSRQPALDEINFWRPGGKTRFTALDAEDVLLFRLKAPINMIAGGGAFVYSTILPFNFMWDAFGIKNGTPDRQRLQALIASYKGYHRTTDMPLDAEVGCIILRKPFFLPREEWIPVPSDLQPSRVQGQAFNPLAGSGLQLLDALASRQRIAAEPSSAEMLSQVSRPVTFGAPRLMRPRLGQGSFRAYVGDVYARRCAVTGEKTFPILEAAHIRPVKEGGWHSADNGLLLRSDIHKLFDLGYVTVDEEFRFRVSERLKKDWTNGKIYYEMDRTPIRLPEQVDLRPSRDALEWHRDVLFRS